MGYFLCLQKCVKKSLLYRGYITESEGKYLIPIKIRGDDPEGNIVTCSDGSAILANNNEYDSNYKMIDKDYAGVYKTRKGKFFVSNQEGQGAILKMITGDEAENIYRQMSRKIIISENLFLTPSEAKKRSTLEMLDQWEIKRPERERRERIEEIKKQPYWWLEYPEFADDVRDFD